MTFINFWGDWKGASEGEERVWSAWEEKRRILHTDTGGAGIRFVNNQYSYCVNKRKG